MKESMREKLQKAMWGRYGSDRFSQFLFILALVLFVINMIFKLPLGIIPVAVLLYGYYRMFSKNIAKRQKENQWYLKQEGKARNFILHKKSSLQQTKQYHIYKCPNCKQKIRVPRGRGRIAITCRSCGNEFIKKS